MYISKRQNMKVGDTIAIPGYGEYELSLGDNACYGCAAENDLSLCYSLPTSYCTYPARDVERWYDLIFIKAEKRS